MLHPFPTPQTDEHKFGKLELREKISSPYFQLKGIFCVVYHIPPAAAKYLKLILNNLIFYFFLSGDGLRPKVEGMFLCAIPSDGHSIDWRRQHCWITLISFSLLSGDGLRAKVEGMFLCGFSPCPVDIYFKSPFVIHPFFLSQQVSKSHFPSFRSWYISPS